MSEDYYIAAGTIVVMFVVWAVLVITSNEHKD